MAENRFLGSISSSSIRNLLPRSMSTKKKLNRSPKVLKSNSENVPPVDPNIQINGDEAPSLVYKEIPTKMLISRQDSGTETSPCESVPLVTPLKHEVSGPIDPSVEVIVRIRSANEEKRQGDLKVRKLSSDTLSIAEREFAFDHVFDSESKQDDIFQHVGIPLVKNALGGYNTSILSCGQTGTGKTYTMWGPPSAMVEDISPANNQGIVPRILKMLFSEIQKEHENSEKKQINYQCRCSFLEVYNEQIGDLLDPTQRNLEIRDEAKSGLYIENLTEEYLTSYEDVIQILIKGLSSRKVGATTVNSKSSRSHVMFNFIIESWSKENSTSFGSSKTSRVSFIDLAGLDRNLKDDVDRKYVRDAKNLKKSLSRLGHLVNTLSNETLCGKAEDALYKSSSLTRLLRNSIGGNAKLTVICAISPDKKYITETLKTLRFGQRLKCIKNIPVINEITEDDVNDLSDQIRKLKEELIRAKSSSCNSSMGSLNGYFQGQNVRESLNQLRLSLNRSLILPGMGGDDDEHVNFDEQDVKELHQQLYELNSSIDSIAKRDSLEFSSAGESFETDSVSDDDDVNSPEEETDKPQNDTIESLYSVSSETVTSKAIETMIRSSLSINPGCRSPILEDPPLSESPKIGRSLRKSMAISSSLSLCHKDMSESSKLKNDESTQLQKSRVFQGPTESLAASLQRGLDIIDYHQKNSALNKSLVSFSFEHLALKTGPAAPTTDSLTFEDVNSSVNGPSSYLCASCRMRIHKTETGDIQNNSKLPLINETVDGDGIQLDHLPEEHGQENDNTSLGRSTKKLTPPEEPQSNEKCNRRSTKKLTPPEEPQSNEKCNPVENHQADILTDVCEIKEEPSLENQNGFSDVNEKEALLKEIQSLKSKLQSFPVCSSDVSVQKSADKMRSSLLARSIQLRKSGLDFKEISEEELEKERERWMEMESDWISLTDELRIDLESSRRRAEKVEMELRLEKMCKEELEDVIQRAVLGHARIIEHYAELQEKYNELVEKHRVVMEGIEEFKRAAEKARFKGHGSRFAKCLTAELLAVRRQKEREREFLKKENKSLRSQLRDTAEAVHAAGELLARLREAEQSTLAAEENVSRVEQENEKLKKQMEKLKAKHKTEMAMMKQYLADSRLPASAIQPTYREESEIVEEIEEDQAWRKEFRAVYRDHY